MQTGVCKEFGREDQKFYLKVVAGVVVGERLRMRSMSKEND